MSTPLRFGLIGSGFIGRAHAIALAGVGTVFPEVTPPVCEILADRDDEQARAAAKSLGFRRATGDWRELVADPAVDVVDICAPNHLHREMALAAIAAGKHVWCEKPLALDAAEAGEVADAARRSGVNHLIGFNYACNPLLRLAQEIVAGGELGTITGFSGRYFEDYMADPAVPHSWRCERRLAGAGALADLGSHLVDASQRLLGPVESVSARLETIHRSRRVPSTGAMLPVENEDIALAMIRFASGVTGSFEISRVATGFKCGLSFTVFGTAGSLSFDQERMNELRLYASSDAAGRRGFRTILAGPEHPDYRFFCVAPGHGLGINDLKVIEARNLIRAIADGVPARPGFDVGLQVQQVMEAMERSHSSGAWTKV
ncbi:MAG: Gfo/Idh/MocA family protein [Steroidobacteraceae bacterium]